MTSERADILLAEDDEADVLLMRRAFEDAGVAHALHVTRDGKEAMDFLSAREQSDHDIMPALVILDLKMPRRGGMEVLEWIRGQPGLRCLPVFIFSSSAQSGDVERAYALGANAFIVKPPSTVKRAEVARFINDWLRLNQPPLAVTDGLKVAQAFHASRGVKPLAPG